MQLIAAPKRLLIGNLLQLTAVLLPCVSGMHAAGSFPFVCCVADAGYAEFKAK